MERKRSIYIAIAVFALLALNHWLLGDVVSRAAFVVIKKPFGYIQRTVLGLAGSKRDEFNERTLDQTATIEKLERENKQLRKQLGVTSRTPHHLTMARVISFEQNYTASTIMIDHGTNEGVQAGNAVVSGGNILVGIVRETYPHASRVYLVDDPRVHISARLSGSSILAELQGTLRRTFALNLISRSETVAQQTLVVTSGMDGLPESLVVGLVTTVEDKSDALFRDVRGSVSFKLGDTASVFIIL